MAVQEDLASTNLRLTFMDGQSYTYAKIKADASDAAILKTGAAIAKLKRRETKELFKLTKSDLYTV